jgi:hypothetical protein
MRESLTGIWERYKGIPGGEGQDLMGLLCITPEKFSYIEGLNEVREFYWKLVDGALMLSSIKDAPGTDLKIDLDGEDLKVWWTDQGYQTYRRTGAENTLDLVLGRLDVRIDPPEISQYRILEDRRLIYYLSLGFRDDGSVALLFNFKPVDTKELKARVEEYCSGINKLDRSRLTAMLWVDRDMPMAEVIKVKEELRKANALKIADGGYPWGTEHSVSPLLYSSVALPRLLPPPDAEIMEKDQVEKEGIRLFTIDLSQRNTTPADVEKNLERFIGENEGGKYLFSLEYDGQIPYGQYIESVDMVFKVVYGFRRELSMRRFHAPYESLGDDLQKEIRQAYPMVLSEAWSGL